MPLRHLRVLPSIDMFSPIYRARYDAATGYCNVELPDGRTTKFRPENLAAPYN